MMANPFRRRVAPFRMPKLRGLSLIHILKKPWATTGMDSKNGVRSVVNSLYINPDELEEVCHRLEAKYEVISAFETDYESYMVEDADLLLVAYGTTARICKSAVAKAREEGIKLGLLRPKTVWPFPYRCV